jgi:hypothetical protein
MVLGAVGSVYQNKIVGNLTELNGTSLRRCGKLRSNHVLSAKPRFLILQRLAWIIPTILVKLEDFCVINAIMD